MTTGMLAGCGADESTANDARDAPFDVSAVATLEPAQRLGSSYRLRLTVFNREQRRSLPTVNVTMKGFSRAIDSTDNGAGRVADPRRPVWIIDSPPRGASTAYRDTWSFRTLKAARSSTFVWTISPVRPGRHALRWNVSAGLDHGRPVATDKRGARGVLHVQVRP